MKLYISTAPRCADCGSLNPELVKDTCGALVCVDRLSCETRQITMNAAPRQRPVTDRIMGLRSASYRQGTTRRMR